jgi:hypothetical protein
MHKYIHLNILLRPSSITNRAYRGLQWIELTLVAGNDVKFITVVQPMLLLWSLWFQDGGVSNFSGSAFSILAIAYFPLII